MVLHSSRFLVLSMISTSLIFNSWLRLFMKFSRGLPLLLSPSIFPVTTMFSSPCFLMICPRKLICPALILFINLVSLLLIDACSLVPLFPAAHFLQVVFLPFLVAIISSIVLLAAVPALIPQVTSVILPRSFTTLFHLISIWRSMFCHPLSFFRLSVSGRCCLDDLYIIRSSAVI